MINVMKNVMAVFAIGFALAGCGVAPDDEPLQLSSTEAALANGNPTTRAVCVACGCVRERRGVRLRRGQARLHQQRRTGEEGVAGRHRHEPGQDRRRGVGSGATGVG